MTGSQTIIFDSKPNPERHPDRLRVIAALRGLTARPFSNCTTLDIGCGIGADLIHFAQTAPKSTFHGFDLSEEHLDIGRGIIQRLGLSNITLESADIADFTSTKKFDYIFCHGVFSWVNETLRKKILALCSELLSHDGVAFISFNCLPGWQSRATLRKLLRQTDDPGLDPVARVDGARETMQITLARLEESQTPHSQQMQEELQSCLRQSNAFIFHELLAEVNDAFFLDDFLALAEAASLQYLGDGRPSRMRILPGELEDRQFRQALKIGQRSEVTEEQIWDTLMPPSIRSCLLCRSEHLLAREIEFSHVFNMSISSGLVPLSKEPRLTDTSIEIFCDAREYNIEVRSPALKAALTVLSRKWPLTTSVQSIVAEVAELTGGFSEQTDESSTPLITQLGEYFFMNLLDLYIDPPRLCSNQSDKPVAFPLARQQALLGFSWVSNPRFEYALIDELDRQILILLDGTHSAADIATILLKKIEQGELEYRAEEGSDESFSLPAAIAEQITRSLTLYCESALFVG